MNRHKRKRGRAVAHIDLTPAEEKEFMFCWTHGMTDHKIADRVSMVSPPDVAALWTSRRVRKVRRVKKLVRATDERRSGETKSKPYTVSKLPAGTDWITVWTAGYPLKWESPELPGHGREIWETNAR